MVPSPKKKKYRQRVGKNPWLYTVLQRTEPAGINLHVKSEDRVKNLMHESHKPSKFITENNVQSTEKLISPTIKFEKAAKMIQTPSIVKLFIYNCEQKSVMCHLTPRQY